MGRRKSKRSDDLSDKKQSSSANISHYVSSASFGEDAISQLPADAISHISTFLTPEEEAKFRAAKSVLKIGEREALRGARDFSAAHSFFCSARKNS